MRIDKFIKTNDTKVEQLTKMMAETLVNAEGIANLAYLWDLEDSQIYLDYQDKLNQLSVERKKTEFGLTAKSRAKLPQMENADSELSPLEQFVKNNNREVR